MLSRNEVFYIKLKIWVNKSIKALKWNLKWHQQMACQIGISSKNANNKFLSQNGKLNFKL